MSPRTRVHLLESAIKIIRQNARTSDAERAIDRVLADHLLDIETFGE